MIIERVILAIDYYDNKWLTVVLEVYDHVYEWVVSASHAYVHIKLVQAVYILPKEFQRNLEYARYPASIILLGLFTFAMLLLDLASNHLKALLPSIVLIYIIIMICRAK